ncbi:adaptin N terminal region-domain-containing protein [Melampsora americana]|nr:adaptin N terminal region-domain-containing protein [Melampsora americana]
MSQDAKLFSRGKVQELRAELQTDKKDKGFQRKKNTLKKVVANMTMGNDMSPLFSDVVQCMGIQILEIKKMVYLYLINYSRSKPDLVQYAMEGFLSDCNDRNPLIRALAIRTMSYIPVPAVHRAILDPLRHCLKDSDPYVRKTSAICVAKLFTHDRKLVEKEGFVNSLRDLLADSNSTVIANAVAALTEISEKSENIQLRLNLTIANKLVAALGECSEWGQTYIIEALMYYVPEGSGDAEILAERLAIRLQHSNSAVVLTTIKVIIYLMNYMADLTVLEAMCKRMSASLITLLSSGYEVQYVALRNILLIIQRRPSVLKNQVKVFFCKYTDPIYVKLAKLEIIYRLANEQNFEQVLAELAEYASEVDVDFVRKAVRSIGRLAIKISCASDRCIAVLLELVATKINYVVQEAIVVIKDIFRKYPNQYEGIIGSLCQNLDALDTPEAKSSMIWIIGQYADRIENSEDLLDDFLYTFLEEPVEVQLALLTATVKLFIKRPTAGAELVPKILKWATEEVDNPDLRDRGYIYWRLLSTNPAAAKDIVMSEKPSISTESEAMDRGVLDRLLLQTGTLSSVYHRSPEVFIRNTKPKYLTDSPALNSAAKQSYHESLSISTRKPPPILRTSTVPKPEIETSSSMMNRPESSTRSQTMPVLLDSQPPPILGVKPSLSQLKEHEIQHGTKSEEEISEEMEMGMRSASSMNESTTRRESEVMMVNDDPYAALGSLDPTGFYGASAYQTDVPLPLSHQLVESQLD